MKSKVLVVDDDAGVRELLSTMLGDYYDVTQAESGAALRKALGDTQPDLVVLDVNLQDENGLDLLPQMKKRWPDTEVIVDYVLKKMPEQTPFSILDLGVGSGAILLSILAERPAAKGLGVDVSEEALAVARDNAAHLGLAGKVALLRSDWTSGLGDANYDVVVSNPPYIASHVIETLEPEVKDHEPRLALDGGPDGLDHYRVLAPEILRVLKPGGLFAVEIGYDQKIAVEALFNAAGAEGVWTIPDLAMHDRVVVGMKKALETSQ